MSTKLRLFAGTFGLGLLLDQGTKLWIANSLHYGERVSVISGFFELTHVRNPGGAFSMWANGPAELRLPFFVGATFLAVVLLIAFFRRIEPDARLAAVALGSIMAGATGNLIDRIAHGEVIDFLEFTLWRGYSWPTFNMADSLIVVGVAMLLVEIFAGQEAEHAGATAAEESPSTGSG